MNTPATRETSQLQYNKDYNEGYNAGFLATTQRVDYLQLLNDDSLWEKRSRSLGRIILVILAAAIFIPAAIFIAVMIFLGMLNMLISAGYSLYIGASPFALLALLAYLYGRGKRDA